MPKPDRWVFLVGCYNSGTTLLHDLLASNPNVGSLHTEGQFLTDQLVLPKAVGLARLWASQPEHFQMDESSDGGVSADKIKRQWGARFDDPNRPVLIEKSPTNAARTRWLQRVFIARLGTPLRNLRPSGRSPTRLCSMILSIWSARPSSGMRT
jgi:hypothetical protein